MSATPSALNQIDGLINKIDTNMSQEESKDDSKENECKIQVLGLGNPLLDISSNVDDAFMQKYGIKADNAILAEAKHLPMYQELASMSTVEYIGGGSTLNSMRVCSWMSQERNTAFMGCIGVDQFGQVLESATNAANVDCFFMKDEKTATGTCAVCITDKERSLVANLAAANNFDISHCGQQRAKQMIAAADVIYTAGFFITVSVDTMLMLGAECLKQNKPYCINLSAEFITTVFKQQLLSVLPFVRILFANKDEATSFAKANDIKYADIKDLAVKIAKLKTEKDMGRTVVITQGCDAVVVATNDEVKEYAVGKIEKEKIVDVNGAGDAFVGGFLSQFVKGKEEAICIDAGNYAAQYMIQRAGTQLEGKPTFTEQ